MNQTPITRLVCTLLSVAALASSALAFAQAGPGKGETVRVQDYPGIGNALVRVAIAKQYCEKYGIKCTVRSLANGPLGLQVLMAGELDVAYSGAEVVYQLISRGAALKVISGGYEAQPFFLSVGAGTEMPNRSKGYPAIMADFKGKKIGVFTRGSHAEMLFTDMLIEAGLSAKDVTFVAVGGPVTIYPALLNRQIDAAVAATPVDAFCEVAKTCSTVLDMRKGEGPKSVKDSFGAGIPMWMKTEYIAANPHVLKAFRLALADAETFLQNPANFEELSVISGTYFKVPGEQGDAILRVALRNSVAGMKTAVKLSAMQAVADYMFVNKQLPVKLDAAALMQP